MRYRNMVAMIEYLIDEHGGGGGRTGYSDELLHAQLRERHRRNAATPEQRAKTAARVRAYRERKRDEHR